jgi:hypothetical protein
MPDEQRVLIDTDVWTQLYLRAKKGDDRVPRWREQLVGVTVAPWASDRQIAAHSYRS